jgi:hypothetical protein
MHDEEGTCFPSGFSGQGNEHVIRSVTCVHGEPLDLPTLAPCNPKPNPSGPGLVSLEINGYDRCLKRKRITGLMKKG